MTALYWQTLIILAAAYFLGAFLACMLRKLIGGGSAELGLDEATAAAVSTGGAAAALGGTKATAPTNNAATPLSRQTPSEPFRRADRDAPTGTSAISSGSNRERFAKALSSPGRSPDDTGRPHQHQAPVSAEPVRPARPQTPAATTPLPPQPSSEPTRSVPRVGGGEDLAAAATAGVATIVAAANTRREQGRAAAPVAPAAATKPAVSRPAAPLMPIPSPKAAATTDDDLENIRSINAAMQETLRGAGIRRYGDIADWTAADVRRISREFNLGERISEECWIEQAKVLASGGLTRFARMRSRGVRTVAEPTGDRGEPRPLADRTPAATPNAVHAQDAASQAARTGTLSPGHDVDVPEAPKLVTHAARPTPRADIGLLKSVRSEAFRSATGTGSGDTDDLKRIRGVGVLIEKKLNQMGIRSYEQIANWSNADIERASEMLDFRGRIERENWIEQARILASGGQTEFSKRVDRGEVESSRLNREPD